MLGFVLRYLKIKRSNEETTKYRERAKICKQGCAISVTSFRNAALLWALPELAEPPIYFGHLNCPFVRESKCLPYIKNSNNFSP